MAKLNSILVELLQENQVLILPGFGAFTIQKVPAQHKAYSHYFIPPSAKISFNPKIQRDNNELALELAGRKNIPFTEALAMIASLVNELKRDLNQHKQATIEGIGTLTLTSTNKLVFLQAQNNELLDDAFGLIAFHKLPVARKTEDINTSKELKLPAALKYGITGAAAALLGFSLSFLPLNNSTTAIQQASVVQSVDSNTKPAINQPTPQLEPQQTEVDTEKQEVNEIEAPQLALETPKPAAENYHVIVGCFSNEQNAQKIIDSLGKFSYSAKILDVKNGLYRVSVPFESAVIAENELQAIRSNVVRQAWLLKL